MIGPTLPPHLRPKSEEEKAEKADISEVNSPQISPPSKPSVTGPQLPPHLLAAREAKRKRKHESEDAGPYPPSPPSKRPIIPETRSTPPTNDSDSDTEVGPSLTAMMTPAESAEHTRKTAIERLSSVSPQPTSSMPSEPKLQRDSWMLAPPTRADWLGTLDASKLKGRTFNQSKSSNTAKSVDHTIWTETPLERAQRLENEALGRKTKPVREEVEEEGPSAEELERERRIKEYNAQTRGPSLMEKHAALKKDDGDVDDPSKRAFDYQKDIAGGTMGFKERNAMIGRAKDLDSKYSRGNYL